MSRIFLSHSSGINAEVVALRDYSRKPVVVMPFLPGVRLIREVQ